MSTKKPARKAGQLRGGAGWSEQRIAIVASLSVIIGLIALVIYSVTQSGSAATAKIEGVEEIIGLVGSHQEGLITYDRQPPAGGPHSPRWQNCGVYDKPIAPEVAVHTLEHGAIWITYQPTLALDEIARLQSLTRQSQYRLLSPYPNQASPIVLTAWGYQLKLTRADDARLGQFIKKYENSPFAPEPGAACSGGLGSPL